MIAQYGKRALSFFLALIMILSAVPVQVFAEENHDHQEEHIVVTSETPEETPAEPSEETPEETSEEAPVETPAETFLEAPEEAPMEVTAEAPAEAPDAVSAARGESEALIALRAEIAAYIDELGINPEMPDSMLLAAYNNHRSYEAAQASLTKQDEFVQKGMQLSALEQQVLLKETNTKLCLRYREVAEKANAVQLMSEFAAGDLTISNNGGTLTHSNGVYTATAKSDSSSCMGTTSYTTVTMYIYIKNNSGVAGTVSFAMEQSNINSLAVGDENIKGLANYTKHLEAGGEFVITLKTGENTNTNTLVLKNVTFAPDTLAFTVKVEYPNALGSVTTSAEGTTEEADGITTITIPDVTAAEGVTLTASGSTFLGWVDQNNALLSTEKVYTVKPSADMTVKAVMTDGKAYFLAGGAVYSDLNAAGQAAAGASVKTVTLMNDGVLDAGNYTIPSGVTLSIPCETAYVSESSDYTTKPGIIDDSNKNHDRTAATAYRKLTMASGAVLTINGSLQLAGNQSCTQAYNGMPVDPVGWITMESGSRILVNGNLYAWGIIDGSGTVDLNSGATAYECFYITDWRGGTATTGMVGNKNGVFPMDQYTIPNVKVRMTIHSGAKEYGYMSVKVSGVGIQGASVPFINNSEGMFRINSGSITKWNDGRLHVEVNGDLSVSSLSVSMKLGLFGNTTINSANYNLPINNMMSVTVKSGSKINVNQDLALLPGSELIVESGATATLGSNKKIVVYDADDFNGADYVWPNTTNEYTNAADAKVIIDGTADLSAGAAYTTSGGANISGSGTIIVNGKNATSTTTYQYNQIAEEYVAIAIQPGALQNANGTSTTTADDMGKVIYTAVEGNWVCQHTYAAGTFKEAVTVAAACEATGLKTLTCYCGGHTKTEEIPVLGHNYNAVVTAPTCLADGYTTHTCQNGCGSTYTDEVVAALGHDEVSHEAQAPTCTEIGWEAYVACSRCEYTTYAQIPSLGHTETQHEGQAPTCTEIGWNAYVTCSVCGYSSYEEIPALGHDHNAVVTEPTCTDKGFTTHTCSVCGDTYTDSETEATGHAWEWVVDKAATVLESGIKHEECSVCGETQNENTEIPMLVCAHTETMTGTEAKAETCTERGNSAYWYCSACQNYYSDAAGQHEIEKDSWILDALGHDEVEHEAQAVTCTEIGWDAYVTCSRCDYTTYVEIPALDHDEVEHEAQAATCQEPGWEAYVTCSRCDYSTEIVELPVDPDGHVWDEGEEYGNHSCNSALRMKYTCTLGDCGKTKLVVVKEQHFRIPIGEEISATCTEDGMTSGWKCEKCDEFWIPQEVIPALGHDWNGAYPCESDSSACTRCDVHFDTKQEHLSIVDPAVAATCTETGLTEGTHCGYCGVILTAQDETAMTEHNWFTDEMEIPATCTTNGHKAGATYCLDCDYDAEAIPALDHSWMHRDAKKATYSAIGWNAHDYCLLCKAVKPLEEYEQDPCEFCGENPEGYIEIPKVEVQKNKTIDEFLTNLGYLEQMAAQYAKENPGTDPLGLVLNYMRTGVSNYTTGSWAIMAGPENKEFLKYVQEAEDAINSNPDITVWVNVSGLKKLESFRNTHGEVNVYQPSSKAPILSGHFFGTMDMTYYNKGSQNHADVGGWVGDLTDLLSTSDEYGVPANLTLDEKVEYIREKYLFASDIAGSAGSFGNHDLYADLDAYYIMNELITKGYKTGDLERLLREFYQPGLTLKQRVSYLLTNRLDGLSTRQDLRTAVYNAYTSNKLIATLEGTRNFNATGNELSELRKAVCYAFADEMCRIAGDYVEDLTNPRFTVFDTETKILAPGVTQQINYATNADGNQIVYYIATADVNREDVGLWVNYYDRDPGTPENPQWKNNSVPSSAQNAQDRYGDPASEDYIENFNVIASTNAGGYDMSDVATPGGLMVMDGVEWHPQSGTAGFFAILDDGTAYMGTHDEYESMMAAGRIKEAIGGFGEFVVQNGEVTGSAAKSDAPRTSVGITATGRVVLMCIDGRQAPFSSGASLEDVGYIMKEAGCIIAINLDGGGSTTFVARQPGSDDLTVMNRPSDGYPRNVSTNLLIYSTAPSSTAFDHAVIESEYDYATIGSAVQMTAAGVSPAGNAVDVPEKATWAVSDDSWASITEDGVFTGKRLGEVTVYLMLDDQVIGSKLMTMTNVDQLYFEKAKVDVIYGSSVELPLRGRIGGKPIAINPNDVIFTLSAPAAGSVDGFTFTAVESAVKTMTITATTGKDITASINVMLYQQGENSFDFDKATGGSRVLAWDRQVSNAKVEDGNIYNVIDMSEDMVTSYIFALDMTAIPIPDRLEELTYMLPGGTMDGTNAWTFLTSLAQRISDLSYVQAVVDFDDRFVVDYSQLKVLNDYFKLTGAELDESTNTLTMTLNWIKQSQVIDEATANPLFLINGIHLTPKNGVWTDVSKIEAVTSGTIGYEIYMRASGLYSFAQKPENQALFGVYPYRNPADTTDAGGYFNAIYAEVTDTYTLVNAVKEGWVNEDGGFAYYVNGERLTGIQKVEDFYYDFGENGVNVGQTKFTGMFFDEAAKVYRYSYLGELATGWQSINGNWHYFKDYAAVSGDLRVGGIPYSFEENGKLISGVWVKTLQGVRYHNGPSYHLSKWLEVDGNWYYFDNGYRVTGIRRVGEIGNNAQRVFYDFGEDGIAQRMHINGIYEYEGILYYLEDGEGREKYLVEVDGDYYFAKYMGEVVTNKTTYAFETNCDMPKGTYTFGPDGKMVGADPNGEIVTIDNTICYYESGKGVEKYLVEVDGDYYFAQYGGKVVTDRTFYAWESNCDMPKGEYTFGPDGKMLGSDPNGAIVEKDNVLYYYESGKGKEKGLVKVGDDYYFSFYQGKLAVDTVQYAFLTNCDLPKGNYEFGADGKMLNGVVEKDGVLYYYENGRGVEKGLVKWNGDYYFAFYLGKLAVNTTQYAFLTNCDLPMGNYEFGADGKMRSGIVEKDGVLYYYERGRGVEKGLIEFGGDYYFSYYQGKLAVNTTQYAYETNCDLPKGTYEFGPDGKALNGIIEKDGALYYYKNGQRKEMGLIKYDGAYYNVGFDGVITVNQTAYAYITNCDLKVGTYEFGADGRMLNGFVEKNGELYYYENGKGTEKGLVKIGDDYYFLQYGGKVVTGKTQYAYLTNCDMPKGNYEFAADGKMIGSKATGEIVNKDGVLYYYESGKGVEKGLVYLDGYYYFAQYGGKLVVNKVQYVYQTNGLLHETNYTFNELGQIIK